MRREREPGHFSTVHWTSLCRRAICPSQSHTCHRRRHLSVQKRLGDCNQHTASNCGRATGIFFSSYLKKFPSHIQVVHDGGLRLAAAGHQTAGRRRFGQRVDSASFLDIFRESRCTASVMRKLNNLSSTLLVGWWIHVRHSTMTDMSGVKNRNSPRFQRKINKR